MKEKLTPKTWKQISNFRTRKDEANESGSEPGKHIFFYVSIKNALMFKFHFKIPLNIIQ